jgi:hypothetical protein
MSQTLQQHIQKHIESTLSYHGAWMVWCDPQNHWTPLLYMAVAKIGLPHIQLISVEEQTAGEPGSPLRRREIQALINAQQSFVLHINTSSDRLGWLWAQALLSQEIYTKSLREALREWNWRPQNIKTGDEELARLAKLYFHKDPAEWGGGSLQPDKTLLLHILAGAPITVKDDRMILDMTIESVGLPVLPSLPEPIDTESDDTLQKLEYWRSDALARLLITQAHQITPDLFQNHEYLLPAKKREDALDLLAKWTDSVRLSKGLAERILNADRILTLVHYFGSNTTIENIAHTETFLSQAAERTLFTHTCLQLIQESGQDLLTSLAKLHPYLVVHAHGFWGDTPEMPNAARESKDLNSQIIPWNELARLSQAAHLLLQAAPQSTWNRPDDAIQWYEQSGWQVEQAGENLMRHLSHATAELVELITPLRNAYLSHWETYMLQWSALWTNAGCPIPNLPSQGQWLLEEFKGSQPIAVLVVDALRYDIGMGLKNEVNEREGADRAQIRSARTAIPTITALGMGMALPIKESDLRAELVNGKWQLYHKASPLNLSIAENRREWLKTQGKILAEALLTIKDIEDGKIPEPNAKLKRLFIFDSLIDKLGHDEELAPLGTRDIQQRYLRTIEHLREKQWTRILIVTDHGFIHWPGTTESHVAPPMPNPAYSSRRALTYLESTQLSGPQALAPGGKWRSALASGASCFRTYGGLGFFHGGASLQEWIVPCLKIVWPVKARPIDVTVQPISQILSQHPRIVLETRREGIFDEPLARQVRVHIRENRQHAILFRSQPVMLTPKHDSISVALELVEGIEATRNTALTIEVRDTRTEQLLAEAPTILLVEIENW